MVLVSCNHHAQGLLQLANPAGFKIGRIDVLVGMPVARSHGRQTASFICL